MCRDHPHKRPPPVSDHELFTFWRVRLLCDYRLITVLLSVLFLFFLFLFLFFFFFFFFFFFLLLLLWLLLQSEKVILWETQLTIRSLHNYLSIQWHFHFWTVVAKENIIRVCKAWYKHERGWENSRQSCKPETMSRILPTPWVFISGYANTGKKSFLLLLWINFPGKKRKTLCYGTD